MVFSRPTEPTPPPAPRKKPHTKKPRNKRERAAADAAAFLAMTPAQQVEAHQARERANARDLAARRERDAQWDRERTEMNERRLKQEALDNARKAREAEIEKRAGIQWPGSVVDPKWLAANGSVVRLTTVSSYESMETILLKALDETFVPLFDAEALRDGVWETREADRCQKALADGLRELITSVIDLAFEVHPVEVIGTKEMIPAAPDLEKFWDRMTTDIYKRLLADLKRSIDCCIDDNRTGEIIADSTIEELKASALEDAFDADTMMDCFERLTHAQQEAFINDLQLAGYLDASLDHA